MYVFIAIHLGRTIFVASFDHCLYDMVNSAPYKHEWEFNQTIILTASMNR